jgi:hypothetical protein
MHLIHSVAAFRCIGYFLYCNGRLIVIRGVSIRLLKLEYLGRVFCRLELLFFNIFAYNILSAEHISLVIWNTQFWNCLAPFLCIIVILNNSCRSRGILAAVGNLVF